MKKVALITGASRGIGKVVAQGLIKRGFFVALVSRSVDSLKATAEEIDPQGSSSEIFPLDVSDHSSVPYLLACLSRSDCQVSLEPEKGHVCLSEGVLNEESPELAERGIVSIHSQI